MRTLALARKRLSKEGISVATSGVRGLKRGGRGVKRGGRRIEKGWWEYWIKMCLEVLEMNGCWKKRIIGMEAKEMR